MKRKVDSIQSKLKEERIMRYRVTEKVRRLKKRVNSLWEVVRALQKSKFAVSTHAEEHLAKSFSGIPQNFFSRMLKSVRTGEYLHL